MGSIQETELHILEGSDIIGHLSTNSFPLRATRNKIVLHYPLDEVLAIDRSLIVSAILLIESLDVLRTSGWSDAIDHGIREGNVLLHPSCKFGILCLHKGHESLASGVAIVLEVVAREDGDRAIACCLTTAKTFCHISKGSLRLLRILEVVSHLSIVEHELT